MSTSSLCCASSSYSSEYSTEVVSEVSTGALGPADNVSVVHILARTDDDCYPVGVAIGEALSVRNLPLPAATWCTRLRPHTRLQPFSYLNITLAYKTPVDSAAVMLALLEVRLQDHLTVSKVDQEHGVCCCMCHSTAILQALLH
jgi:hypothetical protein